MDGDLLRERRHGFDPSSSLGLGGISPAASTCRSRSPARLCTALDRSIRPTRTSVSPRTPPVPATAADHRPTQVGIHQHRRLPARRDRSAKLAAIVDLPSLGFGLVTTMTPRRFVHVHKSRLVRSFRNASAAPRLLCRPGLEGLRNEMG